MRRDHASRPVNRRPINPLRRAFSRRQRLLVRRARLVTEIRPRAAAAKRISLLNHVNRGLIFALTGVGLLMDGYDRADALCTLAVVVWLWMPLATRLEARLLHRAAGVLHPESAR